MSRVQQASGARFEAWVEAQHAVARNRGLLVHAEHTQAVARVIHGKVIYSVPGVADYVLCLRGGRYAAVEAKASDGLRLYRSRVGPLQARHLDATARGGALALLLVEFNEPSTARYAVPWLDVPWGRMRSADSVCAADLLLWEIIPGNCYLERFVVGMS